MTTDDLRTLLAERAASIDADRPERVGEVHRRIGASRAARPFAAIRTALRVDPRAPHEPPGPAQPRTRADRSRVRRIALGIVTAAVLAVGAIGVVAGRTHDSPPPVEQPEPPTPSPVVRHLPGPGTVTPGRYTFDVWSSALDADVTLGNGWRTAGDGVGVSRGPLWFGSGQVAAVPVDACAGPDGPRVAGSGRSVAAVVAALGKQSGTDLSAPTPVTVGGRPGLRVVQTVSAGVVPVKCKGATLHRFVNPNGGTFWGDDARLVYWVVDVDGAVVAVIARYDPADPVQRVIIESMVRSLEFATR